MPDLTKYIELIQSGEVVAFPTETVYGLGADAWNPTAIRKVFQSKGRPSDNPLIVHISESEQLYDFAEEVPEAAGKLMHVFWPGPLTIIFKKKTKVLDLITAGLNTVAIRMPDHKLALSFIAETGPLVAPSANRSGRPSPTKADHVRQDFGTVFPVIDGGSTEVGLESTVIDMTTDTPIILRPGIVGHEELQTILGIPVKVDTHVQNATQPKSPGQKYSHYKPNASVKYGEIKSISEDTLYLAQSTFPESKNIIQYNGDLPLLSKELYDRFRQADLDHYSTIFIENLDNLKSTFPSFFVALMNRINKAAD